MLGAYFTPLEFETIGRYIFPVKRLKLKFTPLEFETSFSKIKNIKQLTVKIYSVGV